jgi:hypothetical protein
MRQPEPPGVPPQPRSFLLGEALVVRQDRNAADASDSQQLAIMAQDCKLQMQPQPRRTKPSFTNTSVKLHPGLSPDSSTDRGRIKSRASAIPAPQTVSPVGPPPAAGRCCSGTAIWCSGSPRALRTCSCGPPPTSRWTRTLPQTNMSRGAGFCASTGATSAAKHRHSSQLANPGSHGWRSLQGSQQAAAAPCHSATAPAYRIASSPVSWRPIIKPWMSCVPS